MQPDFFVFLCFFKKTIIMWNVESFEHLADCAKGGTICCRFASLLIQDEDDRAYMSRLFVQYHRLMYQCTYEVLDDKWVTEDAVQTTLLRLIDRIDRRAAAGREQAAGAYRRRLPPHGVQRAPAITAATPPGAVEDAPEASSAPDMDELPSRRVELNALAW